MSWSIAAKSERVATRFGKLAVRNDGDPGAPPILLCQRFRGTMEDWDPEFIACLAAKRRVIRFDSAGVGESEGTTPDSMAEMAAIVPEVLDVMRLGTVDILGWSLGGYVAQTVALTWPNRVRRLIVAGSGPGGPDGPPPHPRVAEIAAKEQPSPEDLAFLFFTESAAGVAAAAMHLARITHAGKTTVAPESGIRQRSAIVAWWRGEGAARARLADLALPVLVANGNRDVMIPPEHSLAIATKAPNAKLILYPDAGHGFLFQYAGEFTREVHRFIDGSQ